MATNNSWNNTISDADTTLNGGTVNIATDAVAHTVTIGNNTGATAVNIDIGTGDFTLDSATGTLISQLDSGEMTRPVQPAFLAHLATDVLNVTGDNFLYNLGFITALTEDYDQGGDFVTSGTFTAPVTGRYLLYSNILMRGITAAMTFDDMRLTSSNRTIFFNIGNAGAIKNSSDGYTFYGSILTDMDASDTVSFGVNLRNGAGRTADVDGSSARLTYIGGYLAC